MTVSDLAAAHEARDLGIQRAIDHADRVEMKWSESVFAFLRGFVSACDSLRSPFTAEDVRAASVGVVSDPPDKRAWGGILRRAAMDGLIERIGYTTAHDPKVHCNVVTLWRAKGGA